MLLTSNTTPQTHATQLASNMPTLRFHNVSTALVQRVAVQLSPVLAAIVKVMSVSVCDAAGLLVSTAYARSWQRDTTIHTTLQRELPYVSMQMKLRPPILYVYLSFLITLNPILLNSFRHSSTGGPGLVHVRERGQHFHQSRRAGGTYVDQKATKHG